MTNIALMGNPNCGKTTLFNGLTGSNQHVGNWPGVTVEKKEGSFKYKDKKYNIIDLPGTYSLGNYSEDESVATNFILQNKPSLVINVVDATNLERNLYLTSQLLELNIKVVIALNMMDEAKKRKININIDKLSKELNVPIVATIASREDGLEDLKKTVVENLNSKREVLAPEIYGEDLKEAFREYSPLFEGVTSDYPKESLALKLLEGEESVFKSIEGKLKDPEKLKDEIGLRQLQIVDARYEFISKVIGRSVTRPNENQETLTDKIDKIVTHKYLGIPIFILIMFLIFQLTFTIGEDLLGDSIGGLIDFLGENVNLLLTSLHAPAWLVSLIGEGLFQGVGAVLEFIPLIMILYFFIGILEDTGYMARAAYVMDRVMKKVGLHGKTFIPMIVGFGCNVPGVMATRTLDNKKDRMVAMLINPFMSCGAKLPIYLVFVAAFFPNNGGIVLFTLYALGILVALIMGKIFSSTLFKGVESNFIMELPPYRAPIFKYVVKDMWDKVYGFIKRAGTVIFSVVTLLWVLANLPHGVEPYSQASLLGKIGTFISPIFKPAGFGTWQASVSLFAGIAAKEAVVATLGMVYAGVSEGTKLVAAIQGHFTSLSAASFLVMTLLYTPCVAVIGTIKNETGSMKWAIFTAVYTFVLAWIAAVLVFQVGTLLGF